MREFKRLSECVYLISEQKFISIDTAKVKYDKSDYADAKVGLVALENSED